MRRFEPVVIMIAVLTALAGAGTWLRTEWRHHDAAVLVDRVLTGKPLFPDTLSRAMGEEAPPDRDILPGKHLFFGSTLAVAAADLTGLPEADRLDWLGLARKALPQALAREPAHTHAWTHLAYAEWLYKGANRKSVDALRMSIYTSPADTQILLWRLKLAGLNRDFWDPGFQDLVMRQIALARKECPNALEKIAPIHNIGDLTAEFVKF